MPKCTICGGTDFYVEAGFYFCKECQTQNEDVREEVVDLRVDPSTRVRKIRVRQSKSSISEQTLGWTMWEQYNFIIIGMTNELIELGAPMDIKLTILQLWACYLGKIEAAFFSTTMKKVPKLARIFHKKDAAIIYGKVAQRKKNRRRNAGSNTSASSMVSGGLSQGSSNRDKQKQKKRLVTAEYDRFVQSQESSEGDALSVNQSLYSLQSSTGKSSALTEENIQFNDGAKKEAKKIHVLSKKLPRLARPKYRESHATTKYKISPEVLTPMKLWNLLYLALRIHDSDIQLGDMLRWGREGHLSYYRLDHLLPPEVTITRSESYSLHRTKELTHKGMRQGVATMAKFLNVWETMNPDMTSLVQRYCVELQLPNGIAIYAERIMALSCPKMLFDCKMSLFPNFEGRAMAFIIVVLKTLFGLDGITEYEISRVIDKINRIASTKGVLESRLFSFGEWQRYIVCRRAILTNVHFPTKFKWDPDSKDGNNLYLKFLAAMRSKSSDREEPEVTCYKHVLPRDLTDAMKRTIEKIGETTSSMLEDTEIFKPTLTPQYSYLQQLLQNSDNDLPWNLKTDFYSTKVGYMTNPKGLKSLAAQCKIDLGITDNSAHFIEKIIPTFRQNDLPKDHEYKKLVRLKQPVKSKLPREISEDPLEYLHRRNPGNLFINSSIRAKYDIIRKSMKQRLRETTIDLSDNFGFDEVSSNGKLAIKNDDDDEDEDVSHFDNSTIISNVHDQRDKVSDDFLAKYNVHLTNFDKLCLKDSANGKVPKFALKKPPRKIVRDSATGKFLPHISSSKNAEKTGSGTSTMENGGKMDLLQEESGCNEETTIGDDKSDQEDDIVIENEKSYDFGLNDAGSGTLTMENGRKMDLLQEKSGCNEETTIGDDKSDQEDDIVIENEKSYDFGLNDAGSGTLTMENGRKMDLLQEESGCNEETTIVDDECDEEDDIVIENETSYDFGLNDDEISILHETSVNSSNDDSRRNDSSTISNDYERLFRPHSDYWMYRCKFSHVTHTNFSLIENNMPESFRWLLEECSNVIETSEEDLYEEVCLVESWFADIFENTTNNERKNPPSTANCNLIKKKW